MSDRPCELAGCRHDAEEVVNECERCGHAYTARYGSYCYAPDEIIWLCWDCDDGWIRGGW